MSYSSSHSSAHSSTRSSATFLSQEGVYFTPRSSSAVALRTASSSSARSTPPRKWNHASIRSVESQTSVCPVHVEVVATRGMRAPPGLLSLFRQWRFALLGSQPCSSYQWGWRQASQLDEPDVCGCPQQLRPSAASDSSDGDDEADLSGWAQCGVVYGSGKYDWGDEDGR